MLVGPTKQLASCLRSRAVAYYFVGDFEKARAMITHSSIMARTVGDTQRQRGESVIEIGNGNSDLPRRQERSSRLHKRLSEAQLIVERAKKLDGVGSSLVR